MCRHTSPSEKSKAPNTYLYWKIEDDRWVAQGMKTLEEAWEVVEKRRVWAKTNSYEGQGDHRTYHEVRDELVKERDASKPWIGLYKGYRKLPE